VAREEPTWGYRLVAGYLKLRGWSVGPKRVHRLWRLRGHSLPAPAKRRKIRTGSTLRPKATYRNDVWAWDLVHDCYGAGRPFRCLTVKDEATSYCLAIEPGRHLGHADIKALLRKLIHRYGRPRWIRSDNGGELIASALQEAMRSEGVEPIQIDPGKPWQNGSNESLNGTFRRECLDAEIFRTFEEAKMVIAAWRRRYNRKRPHSSQGYITPEMAYYGRRRP
jgi:putative transposase